MQFPDHSVVARLTVRNWTIVGISGSQKLVDRMGIVHDCVLAGGTVRLHFCVYDLVDARIQSQILVAVLATEPLVPLVREMIVTTLRLGGRFERYSGVPGDNGEIGGEK